MKGRNILYSFIITDVITLMYNFIDMPIKDNWIDEFNKDLVKYLDICGGRLCYSSKTESMLAVIDELVERGTVDAQSLAIRFSYSLRIAYDVRSYSIVSSAVVRLIRMGIPWDEAVKEVNMKYNLPDDECVLRSTPIAIYFKDLNEVLVNSERQALATHLHPISIEASKIYSFSLFNVMHGLSPHELLNALISKIKYEERSLALRIKILAKLLNKKPKDVVKVLGNGSLAHSSIPTALYCFIRSEGDPTKALLCSISLGGSVSGRAIMAVTLATAFSDTKPLFIEDILEYVENYELITSKIDNFLNIIRNLHHV